MSFQNEGNSNNIGLILVDNVNLDRVSTAVPDSGSSTVLLGLAMIGLGLMGWKFTRLAYYLARSIFLRSRRIIRTRRAPRLA
jgi:hypothetical protein